jgi:hypothetical protein
MGFWCPKLIGICTVLKCDWNQLKNRRTTRTSYWLDKNFKIAISNVPIKFHKNKLISSYCANKIFYSKCHCDFNLSPSNLQINRCQLLARGNGPQSITNLIPLMSWEEFLQTVTVTYWSKKSIYRPWAIGNDSIQFHKPRLVPSRIIEWTRNFHQVIVTLTSDLWTSKSKGFIYCPRSQSLKIHLNHSTLKIISKTWKALQCATIFNRVNNPYLPSSTVSLLFGFKTWDSNWPSEI